MMLRKRTLTTKNVYKYDDAHGYRTTTPYHRLDDESYYFLHFAKGRHCHTTWLRRNAWFRENLPPRVVG